MRPIGTYGIIGRANKSNQNRGKGFAIYYAFLRRHRDGQSFSDTAHAVFKSNFPGQNLCHDFCAMQTVHSLGEAFGIAADGWVDGVVGRLRR